MVSAVDKLPTVIACPYTASQYIIWTPNTRRISEEMKFNEKLLCIRKKKGLEADHFQMGSGSILSGFPTARYAE